MLKIKFSRGIKYNQKLKFFFVDLANRRSAQSKSHHDDIFEIATTQIYNSKTNKIYRFIYVLLSIVFPLQLVYYNLSSDE